VSKLSATSNINVEEVPRTELTPELIKTMTDDELNAHLIRLRGNREVVSSGTKTKRSPAAPKIPKDDKSDEEDIFG